MPPHIANQYTRRLDVAAPSKWDAQKSDPRRVVQGPGMRFEASG